jgi:putative DNA primase/helicase
MSFVEDIEKIYPNSKFKVINKLPEDLSKKILIGEPLNETEIQQYKLAKMPRENSQNFTVEEAQIFEEKGFRIGWVLPLGVCIVDIDNKNPTDTLLVDKLLEYEKLNYDKFLTTHGAHYIFKNKMFGTSKNQCIKKVSVRRCALNIVVDTIANNTDSPESDFKEEATTGGSYTILPVNDNTRKVIKLDGIISDVPDFLLPVLTNAIDDSNAAELGSPYMLSDGRENWCFKWSQYLRASMNKLGFLTDQQITAIFNLINNAAFATPEDKFVFENAISPRETNYSQGQKVGSRADLAENTLAKVLEKHTIVCHDGYFYCFNGSYYEPINKQAILWWVYEAANNQLMSSGREEIIKLLEIKPTCNKDIREFNKNWNLIACPNGIIDLQNGTLTEARKEDLNTIFIPTRFNQDPPFSDKINNFMNTLCTEGTKSKEIINELKLKFMYEIAGYCLLKKNYFQKFFIFSGRGGSGKSTFQNIIRKIIGKQNCSSVSLENFNDSYRLATLLDKLVNRDDDAVDGKILVDVGKFKSVVSGDVVQVRSPYKEPIELESFATCMFNCNDLPRMYDKSTGLLRRMILITLDHEVPKEDINPLFIEELTDLDLEYFLFNAVKAVMEIFPRGGFSIMESDNELLSKFRRKQSSVNEFFAWNNITRKSLIGFTVESVYNEYRQFCMENGFDKPITTPTFLVDIENLFILRIETENGQRVFKPLQKEDSETLTEAYLNYSPFNKTKYKGEEK